MISDRNWKKVCKRESTTYPGGVYPQSLETALEHIAEDVGIEGLTKKRFKAFIGLWMAGYYIKLEHGKIVEVLLEDPRQITVSGEQMAEARRLAARDEAWEYPLRDMVYPKDVGEVVEAPAHETVSIVMLARVATIKTSKV